MLEFINNNGVLFSGVCTIVTALIAGIVSLIVSHKSAKQDAVNSLKKELADTKKGLEEYKATIADFKNIENAEKAIDKTNGSIYGEKLSTGQTRDICGYCWEKDHKKIPLIVSLCYDEEEHRYYHHGHCQVCKSHCYDNSDSEVPTEYVSGSANNYASFINA